MSLVIDYNQVKENYAKAAEKGIALPTFCAEDRETLEAILAAAYELGEELGVKNLPIVPAWTSRYPGRQQMTLVSACKDPFVGMELMHSDLNVFAGAYSPYKNLAIMPHLDHAFPWIDEDMLVGYADKFASVMCDASEKPFDENIAITARYVEKVKGRVVVEGGVDEVFESDGNVHKNEATTVEQAKKFVSQTGVDLIVPNVGTEHRATADNVQYNSRRAGEISKAVGKIMCLHGTSSVARNDLSKLPKADGVLGQRVLSDHYANTIDLIKPKLDYVANPKRRDVWFTIVKDSCKEFLRIFNYERFASGNYG